MPPRLGKDITDHRPPAPKPGPVTQGRHTVTPENVTFGPSKQSPPCPAQAGTQPQLLRWHPKGPPSLHPARAAEPRESRASPGESPQTPENPQTPDKAQTPTLPAPSPALPACTSLYWENWRYWEHWEHWARPQLNSPGCWSRPGQWGAAGAGGSGEGLQVRGWGLFGSCSLSPRRDTPGTVALSQRAHPPVGCPE